VGGSWCIWCAYMDRFFDQHADVEQLLKTNYVVVKVNWSATNHNNAFLMQYAVVQSFPFLIVLDENGKLLQAQRTNVLEKGTDYDPDRMKDFLNHWKPS
jgi:thiol:disulfide interchange protein